MNSLPYKCLPSFLPYFCRQVKESIVFNFFCLNFTNYLLFLRVGSAYFLNYNLSLFFTLKIIVHFTTINIPSFRRVKKLC